MILYLIIPIFVFLWIYNRSKIARVRITDWCKNEDYTLLDLEYRFIFRGPFMVPSNGVHMVYFIKVEDLKGNQFSAYIKLGNCFIGLISTNLKVKFVENSE